jgi:hypothetical protein
MLRKAITKFEKMSEKVTLDRSEKSKSLALAELYYFVLYSHKSAHGIALAPFEKLPMLAPFAQLPGGVGFGRVLTGFAEISHDFTQAVV